MKRVVYESSSCIESIEVRRTDFGYVLYMCIGDSGEAELNLGSDMDEVSTTLSMSGGLLPEFIRRDILRAVKGDIRI